MVVHPGPGGPQLHYPRHFVLLGLIGAVLLIPSVAKPLYALGAQPSRHGLSGFDALFALYGLLHALAVAASLCGHRPFWRPVVFVVAAALLNVGVLHLGLVIARLQSEPVAMGPVILVSAGVGAGAYALLARLLLRFRWAWIALAPVACLFGALGGMIGAHFASNFMVLMIAWWLAFSVWLYCADQWLDLVRRARADATEPGVS
jgi:hypothetical protein